MEKFAELPKGEDLVSTVRIFLRDLLSKGIAQDIITAARTPYSSIPMPTLISHPDDIDLVDPLAPAAPFNSARQAAPVLRHNAGRKIGVLLRPCEIRAMVELKKLNQCELENTLLISFQCLGRMENKVYQEQFAENENLTELFYREEPLQEMVCRSCAGCEHFQGDGADLVLVPGDGATLSIVSHTAPGDITIDLLDLTVSEAGDHIQQKAESILEKRKSYRNQWSTEISEKINHIEKFQRLIANCLNCQNCRVACPVCYCRECVFNTDVFAHDPELFLRRAQKKGSLKLPTETTMFHLTRLAHMSHACVGCGHCSSVCPSEIPVADIFIRVASETQNLFSYLPGRSVDEPIPYLVFEETAER